MSTHADHLKHLSPALRQRLEEGLKQFHKAWTEDLMNETLAQVPADHALRFASLVEMTRIDQAKRWKRGQRMLLEQYLSNYPELGSIHTLPVYLIRAEYDTRLKYGDVVEVGEYAQRFPTQFETFYKGVLKSKGDDSELPGLSAAPLSPVAAAFTAQTAPKPTPAAPRPAPSPAPAVHVNVQAPMPTPPRKRRWGWAVALLVLGGLAAGLWKMGAFNDPQAFLAKVQDNLGLKPKGDPAKPDDPNNPNPNPPAVASTLKPTDAVESITVKLDVGSVGASDEPIFLDLGLGFPLWLVPRSNTPATVSFGAVPQEADTNNTLTPGTTATFTFRAKGVPGRDVLNTTPQLLAGVRVGDIRRVGFASLAEQDWELTGFDILVNNQPLHTAKGLKLRPKQLQAEAQARLSTLTQTTAPANAELTSLKELIDSGLASDAEKARFAQLQKQPAAVAGNNDERGRLERQLRGQAPWFQTEINRNPPTKTAFAPRRPKSVLDLFENRAVAQDPTTPNPMQPDPTTPNPMQPDINQPGPGLPNPATPRVLQAVRVTVVVDPTQDQAGTNNFVFVRIGPRKFLIGGPEFPLTAANGPQAIDLDLLSGPLSSEDLTGFGIGMLAPATPQGKGPDRLHLKRVTIDADGQNVFDSDLQNADRLTLAAIRIIPPTQLDVDGTLIVNPTNSRELVFWAAGTVSGFNPETGVVDPLPPNTLNEDGSVGTPANQNTGQNTGVTPNPGIDPMMLTPEQRQIAEQLGLGKPINVPDPMNVDVLPNNQNQNMLPPANQIDPGLLFPGEQPFINGGQFPPIGGDLPIGVVPPIGGGGFPLPNPFPNPEPQPPIIIIVGPAPSPFPSPFPPGPFPPGPFPPGPFPPGPFPPGPLPTPDDVRPIGQPVQIDGVNLTTFTRVGTGSTLVTITWKITGDESTVANYEVTLLGVEDDLSGLGLTPRGGRLSFTVGTAPRGVFTLTRTVPDSFLLAWKFVLPRVEAKLRDATQTGNTKLGAVRSTSPFQTSFVRGSFRNPTQLQGPTVSFGTTARFTTHTAFDVAAPENNALRVPMDTTTPEIKVALRATDLAVGAAPIALRTHFGFSGGQALDNTVQYRLEVLVNELPTTAGGVTTTEQLTDVVVSGQAADANGFFTLTASDQKFHEVVVNFPAALTTKMRTSGKRYTVELNLSLKKLTGDAARPPVLMNTILTKS